AVFPTRRSSDLHCIRGGVEFLVRFGQGVVGGFPVYRMNRRILSDIEGKSDRECGNHETLSDIEDESDRESRNREILSDIEDESDRESRNRSQVHIYVYFQFFLMCFQATFG